MCELDGRQHSFLCPNSTIFNQQLLTCDWWYNVDCSQADKFYRNGPNNDVFKSNKIPDEVFGKSLVTSKPHHQLPINKISKKILKHKTLPQTLPKISTTPTVSSARSFHVSPKTYSPGKPYPFAEFKPYESDKYPMFQLRHRRSHVKSINRKPKPHRLNPTKVTDSSGNT